MTHSRNPEGNHEPSFPRFLPQADTLDQAVEEILGKNNPSAYSILTAMKRIVRQFNLDIEAHGLLFDAYLCGKKALQQGKEIHNPKAWLKGTAYNLAREKSRKRKKVNSCSPDFIDSFFPYEGDGPVDSAVLEEEISAVFKAAQRLQAEKPDVFMLIHQRVVEEMSWQEIKAEHAKKNNGQTISEATLRKRFSRGRKYLRSIFHEATMP
jgi:DNA-directed RNA polymerase specialized sigma24 family protein